MPAEAGIQPAEPEGRPGLDLDVRRGERAAVPAGAPIDDASFAGILDHVIGRGRAQPVLLAVSGGPDSAALMHAAARWGAASGPLLHVASVDHASRPGSKREAEAVGEAAQTLGLPHAVLTWADRPAGAASQSKAREARYRLLLQHARSVGAGSLATAHTLDDQAETVLMRLAEGSGLAGLAGMAAETTRGGLVHLRPFLGIAKASLVATCRARGWSFVEDPLNADERFARSRWRTLMPHLAEEGLDARRLSRFAGRMRRADAALDALAGLVAERLVRTGPGPLVSLDLAALAREPDEIALRVLLRAVRLGGAGDARIPIRLDRAETAFAALRISCVGGSASRRTLAGRLLALDRSGTLVIAPETARRRGRAGIAAGTPHSLGMRDARA